MEGEWAMIPIIISCAFFSMMVAIFYFTSKARSDRARYQAEVQARLIDKFGNGPEFVSFLQSEQGRQFMGNIESAPKWHSRERILSGLRSAIVMSFLGLAFIVLALTRYGRSDGMLIPGVLLLCLGAGFLISALTSARLAKQWGLFDPHTPTTSVDIQPGAQS
jgi:hypothetical protein